MNELNKIHWMNELNKIHWMNELNKIHWMNELKSFSIYSVNKQRGSVICHLGFSDFFSRARMLSSVNDSCENMCVLYRPKIRT